MLREKYEKLFFAAFRVRFFLTPGQTVANNFFPWLSFVLLTIRRHSATRKNLFSYPQGDRSGLRKPKKEKISININHSYHQRSFP